MGETPLRSHPCWLVPSWLQMGNTKTFPVAVTISINGSSADQTSFMLDGGNDIDEYTNVNAPFPLLMLYKNSVFRRHQ
jgi:hypothetical protein